MEDKRSMFDAKLSQDKKKITVTATDNQPLPDGLASGIADHVAEKLRRAADVLTSTANTLDGVDTEFAALCREKAEAYRALADPAAEDAEGAED